MNVLIIGSKGFIGSHLATFYKDRENDNVFECDVVVDYARENYFLIDATNADYQKMFRNHPFDVCINCSGAASVPASIQDPLRDFTLNTYNVVKLLDAIRSNQPACKFINLSSAAVYGNPTRIPICESDAQQPISPYGVHKLHAEQICKMYYDTYQIPTCSLRIFSAYGNGLKKQIFWDVFQKASKSNVVEMFGTGEESRDFIHVDDVVQAIKCCLENAAFTGESINIANGIETTVSDATRIFLECFGGSKEVRFNGATKQGDPINWRAEISMLMAMGYEPTVTMGEGLKRYYEWIIQK